MVSWKIFQLIRHKHGETIQQNGSKWAIFQQAILRTPEDTSSGVSLHMPRDWMTRRVREIHGTKLFLVVKTVFFSGRNIIPQIMGINNWLWLQLNLDLSFVFNPHIVKYVKWQKDLPHD